MNGKPGLLKSLRLFAPRFPALPAGYSDYWVKIQVTLREGSYEYEDDEDAPVGYFRLLGVRCLTGTVREVVAKLVDDGTLNWTQCETMARSPSTFGWRNRRYFNPIDDDGFWHVSGRVLYTAEGFEGAMDLVADYAHH
jgi:hypothetical protein